MRKLVLGDLPTLMGTPEKPSKIEWLTHNGVKNIEGVQIISLHQDMLPEVALRYKAELLRLAANYPFLKRISIALNCWPLKETLNDAKEVIDVAATTFLSADMFFYALAICRELQTFHRLTDICVDLSYHPMVTWPTWDIPNIPNPVTRQHRLWDQELSNRLHFQRLLADEMINDVGVSIENEPVTSDPRSNLTHTGNRLFSEQLYGLPLGWGVTADLQHLGMMLACLQQPDKYPLVFPPFKKSGSDNPDLWNWEAQFRCLRDVMGPITFHVAQVEDPLRHITPPIRWDDPIMPWPLILRLMQELDEDKGGEVWYAVEIGGGHNYPEGYQHDLEALLHLQEYFGK